MDVLSKLIGLEPRPVAGHQGNSATDSRQFFGFGIHGGKGDHRTGKCQHVPFRDGWRHACVHQRRMARPVDHERGSAGRCHQRASLRLRQLREPSFESLPSTLNGRVIRTRTSEPHQSTVHARCGDTPNPPLEIRQPGRVGQNSRQVLGTSFDDLIKGLRHVLGPQTSGFGAAGYERHVVRRTHRAAVAPRDGGIFPSRLSNRFERRPLVDMPPSLAAEIAWRDHHCCHCASHAASSRSSIAGLGRTFCWSPVHPSAALFAHGRRSSCSNGSQE